MQQRLPSPPAPAPVPPAAGFVIQIPALSRGDADRSEDLREPDRIRQAWPLARVLTVDDTARVAVDPVSDRLHTFPARELADEPPVDAVLLGAVDGVDHWAVPGPVDNGSGLRDLGAVLPDTDAGLLTTATALLTWHANARFCPRCGAASTPTPAGWSRVCATGHQDFPRTDAAVIVLVHDGADSIVLARQPIWPKGRMSVLAGFVEAGESLEGTVVREVLEEVGLRVTDVSYLGSQPWPFPRSLMVGFAARAEPGAALVPRDGEIEEAAWFHRSQVRAMLAADPADGASGDGWGAGAAGSRVLLPGPVSIASRMIHGWAAQE